MWNEVRDFVAWLKGDQEAYTPDEAEMSSLVRLVALHSLASIHKAKKAEKEGSNLADDSAMPSSAGN
jgi:hypothetical protein